MADAISTPSVSTVAVELCDNEKGHDSLASDELDELDKCIRLKGIQIETTKLYEYCKALGETLKDHILKTGEEFYGPIFFGRKRFGDVFHMKSFIFEQCMKLMALDPVSLQYNLGVASLCLNTLPNCIRNPQLAKLCLERARLFHPDSPRALTRMGFYILSLDRNVSQARMYFDRSRELDPLDFSTLIALLYCTLQDVKRHIHEARKILQEELSKVCWNDNQLATLYFVRGLFMFFSKNSEINVAKSWITAFQKNKKELEACFEKFAQIKRMYQLQDEYKEVFTLLNFCTMLKDSLDSTEKFADVLDPTSVAKVRKMIKKIGSKEFNEEQTKQKKIIVNRSLGIRPPSKRDTSYITLDKVTVGSGNEEDVKEAYAILGIKENHPKIIVDREYKKIAQDYIRVKESGELTNVVFDRMLKVNAAFATLHRHIEQQQQIKEKNTNPLIDGFNEEE